MIFLLNRKRKNTSTDPTMSDEMSDEFLAFYINTHPAPHSKICVKIQPESIHGMKDGCEWCHKPLPKRYKNHQNTCQDTPEHKFCSRECKDQWCYEKQ